MTLHLIWAVLGMLVLTFGIRLSFLVFGHRLRFPDWLQRSLRYVPAAVLTALIVPMALATPLGSTIMITEPSPRMVLPRSLS